MGEAFLWGLVASSSLVLGGAIALRYRIGHRALGLIMAFGAGVLISAVAFELVHEAFETTAGEGGVAAGLFLGSGAFLLGDLLLHRMGAGARKRSSGAQAGGSGLAIVLGIGLDGIPEGLVLGLTVLEEGAVSVAPSSSQCSSPTCPRRSRPPPASRRRAGREAACSGSGCW